MKSALAFVFGVILLLPANAVTLSRVPGSMLFGPLATWTTSTTENFHPLSNPMPSAGMLSARVSTGVSEKIGNCQLRAAARYSYDAAVWDTAFVIDSTYVTTENAPSLGTTYVDITNSDNTRTWIQFGVMVSNTSGNAVSLCNATLLVEPKEK